MSSIFVGATSFSADISKWNVSRVVDTNAMFMRAKSFEGDISKWGVSRVTRMSSMFRAATSFNIDISKWDVSSVVNMDEMFMEASSFKQRLCGAAWVYAYLTATKNRIFVGSHGSISSAVCGSSVFAPQSIGELKGAVDACLKSSPEGNCLDNGPIGVGM